MTTTDGRRTVRRAARSLAFALALGASACAQSEGPNAGTTLEDLQPDGAPAVQGAPADEEDFARAPNDDTERFLPDQASYLGREVTVSGRIVQVLGPNAFVVGEGELATLVTRAETGLTLQPGTVAQVSGTVGRFAIVDVERELDIDLGDDDLVEFERAPYIMADDVDLLG